MNKINLDKIPVLLPSRWGELSQAQMERVLELRSMGLAKEVFRWQVLKMLLDMPMGKTDLIRYWLMGWNRVEKHYKKRRPQMWAKWSLIYRTEDEDQMDVIRLVEFLEGDVVVETAPIIEVGFDKLSLTDTDKIRVRRPDDGGTILDFEGLLDAIMNYTSYCQSLDVKYLNDMIVCIYVLVNGTYNPAYTAQLSKVIGALPLARKMMVLHWFQRIYEEQVQLHDLVFEKAKKDEETVEDPFGLVGFFYRMAGKQFGSLNELKRTPGFQVLDALQIELFDAKTKPTVTTPG